MARGSMDLRNVGILPQHYTAPRARRPRLESSPSWKSQISQQKQSLLLWLTLNKIFAAQIVQSKRNTYKSLHVEMTKILPLKSTCVWTVQTQNILCPGPGVLFYTVPPPPPPTATCRIKNLQCKSTTFSVAGDRVGQLMPTWHHSINFQQVLIPSTAARMRLSIESIDHWQMSDWRYSTTRKSEIEGCGSLCWDGVKIRVTLD
jgi:hypothetical protein